MVLVLTGVAVIMGAILAWVNSVTSGPIADQKEKALADGIKAVMQCDELTVTSTDTVKQPDNKGKELTFVVYHTQNADKQNLGAAVESTTDGFGGKLRVLVGFNPDGTILGYTLLEHAETPGLGAKADKWFQADGKGSIIGLTPAEPLVVSKIIKNGIIKDNPTFVLMLGMCPTLATTTSASNGLAMGLATMAVLICTNVVISCIKSITPDKVRIPVFIVVIAAFVTLLQMLIKAYLPDIDKSLGLFIPLIVVNCIILGRAEAFAAKNSPLASLFDGIGIGLGFTLGLTLLGIVREILGSGAIFGFAFIPENYNILLFVLAPGAFITLGYLIAIVNKFRS